MLFWKEVSKMNGGKMEGCSRTIVGSEIKDMKRTWKEYFEGLYNIYRREGCSQFLASMVQVEIII